MYVVPEEFLKRLERKESLQTPPLAQKMIRLDEKMDTILQDNTKSSDEKVSRYNQNLQQFLDAHEINRQFIPTVKIYHENNSEPQQTTEQPASMPDSEKQVEIPLTDNEILDAIPKNSKTLARSMINRLKTNNDQVSWNSKGEIAVDGNLIKGSNIIDLISDQLKSRKKFNPTGWENFTEVLDRINMPRYLMRNENRRNYIQAEKTPVSFPSLTDTTNVVFPPTPPTTPKTSKPSRPRRYKPKQFSDNWIKY